MYSQNRVASSFVLGVSAREELGRCKILWKCANELSAGQTISHDNLAGRLDDHVVKLKAGQSITPVPLTPAKLATWTSAIESGESASASAAIDEVQVLAKRIRKRAPHDLHMRRVNAQYPVCRSPNPAGVGRSTATLKGRRSMPSYRLSWPKSRTC